MVKTSFLLRNIIVAYYLSIILGTYGYFASLFKGLEELQTDGFSYLSIINCESNVPNPVGRASTDNRIGTYQN